VQYGFLRDLVIVFTIGGLVVYGLRAVKLPANLGLLIAGAAMGPHGLSLVDDVHRVEVLAEIGVVLLLFTIGLELSLGQLLKMWRNLLGAGGGQVVLCIATVAGVVAILQAGSASRCSSDSGGTFEHGDRAAVARRSRAAVLAGRTPSRSESCSSRSRIVPLMLDPSSGGARCVQGSIFTLLEAVAVVVGVVIAARWIVPRQSSCASSRRVAASYF
jgi:CPA2 family monovalent cation:H+ antiporter-2